MNKAKAVVSGPTVQDKLIAGVNTLADAVGSTLGPLGRNVVIETPYGHTTLTKDGVTVADVISLEDPIENLAADIIKQAAKRTAQNAGDGTTTATVIAQSLINEARKLITSGIPPIQVKRDFETYLKSIVPLIQDHSHDVSTKEDIYRIALISANNDPEIASLISEAMEYVGKEGTITLDESRTSETYVDLVDGYSFDKGYASAYFATNDRQQAILENPLIFITDKKLTYINELVPLLDLAVQQARPLVIIADDIEGQALGLLVVNKVKAGIPLLAVRAPSYGDNRTQILNDIAALTSARVISETTGSLIENTTLEDLGQAARIIADKSSTTIVDPLRNEELILSRAEAIRTLLPTHAGDSYFHKQLQTRLSKLTAKVAVLYVGAPTETDLKEKKYRVDDALRATTCAVQKGYVVGGGTLLAKLSTTLPDTLTAQVFAKALQSPLRKIASNADVSPDLVLAKVLESSLPNYGYNALTNTFEDLILSGVIDPSLVVKQALLNAVSAANMVLLSSTAIYNIDRTAPYSPGSLDDYQND